MGGTAPSRRPAGSFGALFFGLRDGLRVTFGRGEETRGGGVAVRWGSSLGRAGEGRGGGAGMPLG